MKNATLKIYGDIGESFPDLFGDPIESFSAKQVSEFIEANTDATQITVRINSRGGDVQEGWAIHDLLVNSGKKIVTIGEGKIYSIATIIFLAGSERDIMKNADGLIHNPFIPPYTLADQYESTDLVKIAEALQQEEEKILEFYALRTGSPKDKLATYMKDSTKLSAEDMLALGFATKIIEPIMAYAFINLKNNFNMDEKAFFEKLGATLDGALSKMKNFSRITPAAMTLTDKDGKEVNIEKESGTPEVGDKASPDGTFTMADGTVVVVAEGSVTDVKAPDEDELAKAKNEIEELKTKLAAAEAEKESVVAAEAKFKEQEAIASGIIADLTKMKNEWKPAARSKEAGAESKNTGGVDMDRVRELRAKL